MKPYKCQITGGFHTVELLDSNGREITNVLDAIEAAENDFGDQWDSVFNGEHAVERDPWMEVQPLFQEFRNAYIAAMLWSTTGDDEEPLDNNFDNSDIADETMDKINNDCIDFLLQASDMVEDDPSQAGHDFWLTRARHGVGFWDGDWPEHGAELTELCEKAGELWPYVGDDQKIYF